MTPRRLAAACAIAVASGGIAAPAAAADLPGGGRAWFVGPECRVRAEGPIDCDEVTRVRALTQEPVSVQLVVEAGSAPVDVLVELPRLSPYRVEAQLFVSVRTRSRGRHPREALPWSAAARPPDEEALGDVADPLVLQGSSGEGIVAPGERRAWWLTLPQGPPGTTEHAVVKRPLGGPVLVIERLERRMPPPIVSAFAYLERDEPRLAEATFERRNFVYYDPMPGAGEATIVEMLEREGVLPVARATSVDELGFQLDVDRARSSPRRVARDLVVLGAYGSLGEPTDDALRRVEAMAAAIPEEVRDVVLYAIDEDCESDLGPRWRARLRAATGAARRVKVLVTCSDDPTELDVDVIMTTAERFRPALAAAARAQGKEVWVYNGRLPQAGPMALDAPPESMIWLGWIAARYDVRRWFLWNVNFWSDGNRGGHGPRDPYADPETFHNADGDAVLLDGLLIYPPRAQADRSVPAPVVRSARLARLGRGLLDARLVGIAATIDPAATQAALDLVVPRALGDVRDDEPTPLGDGRAIARARALLHDVIARAAPDDATTIEELEEARREARAGLVVLRARRDVLGVVARARGHTPGSTSIGAVVPWLAGAACLGAGAIAARRLARRRRAR